MERKVFAVINSHKGLTDVVKNRLDHVGQNVFNVTKIIIEGDKFKVACDLDGAEFTIDGDNVSLYRTYGDDVKLYDPLKDNDLQKPVQQGE